MFIFIELFESTSSEIIWNVRYMRQEYKNSIFLPYSKFLSLCLRYSVEIGWGVHGGHTRKSEGRSEKVNKKTAGAAPGFVDHDTYFTHGVTMQQCR